MDELPFPDSATEIPTTKPKPSSFTVDDLIAKLQWIREAGPVYGSLPIESEGCDCIESAGGATVDFSGPDSNRKAVSVTIRRA